MMQCGADCGAAPVSPYFTEFVEGRRGEILDAALAVFAIKGYECGTMREIAAELGVTEPALYRHYAGKEALFEDLVAVAGDRVVERASAVIDGLDPARVRDSLLELIRTRRGHGQGDAGFARTWRARCSSGCARSSLESTRTTGSSALPGRRPRACAYS
jgi:AcrR family transcriptional regulator